MREETVTVKIDHPLGSTDEDNPSVVYPINCGYVDFLSLINREFIC
jgi:hypothetical protein